MGARRKGRELAVQALYQIELRADSSPQALQLFWQQSDAGDRAKEFAVELIQGVQEHRPRIDTLITEAIEHWRFERLSTVDLNVLRVATYELIHGATPTNVALDEAIEVARRYGTAESPTFVNGVLDQIAGKLGVKEKRAPENAGDDD